MEEIEASSNVEEGGEQDLQVTQLELEQGAYEAFRVLVKNIASEITDGRQLEMLGYFQNIPAADCKQKSSLEMLDEMMRKGKFSHTNVQPLKKTLENIDRTDLIRMVDQYNHTYMEAIIQVQSIRSSRRSSRVNSLPTHDTSSRPYTPPTHSYNRHSLPSLATPIIDPLRSLPKVGVTTVHQQCPSTVFEASLPEGRREEGGGGEEGRGGEGERGGEEEGRGGEGKEDGWQDKEGSLVSSMKSMVVGGTGTWLKAYRHQQMNLESQSAFSQEATPIVVDRTSGDPPTSPSAVITVPPSSAHHYLYTSRSDKESELNMSITSKQSVEIVGAMELEPSDRQLKLSLPYATSSAATAVPPRHSPATPMPPDLQNRPKDAPTLGMNEMSMEKGNVVSSVGGGGGSISPKASSVSSVKPCCQDNLLNNLAHSLPADMSHEKTGESMKESLRKSSKSYKTEDAIRLDTQQLSMLICDRENIGTELTELKLIIPIKCTQKSMAPTITIKVVPRRVFSSECVSVVATLTIPSRCSRRRWLINYTHSVICLSTDVFKEGQNTPIATATAEERIVPISEQSCEDHSTHLILDSILQHNLVMYDKASFFTLRLVAELVVYGFHGDESASNFKLEEQDDKYIISYDDRAAT